MSDLSWAIALQLKDVHGVVDSASIMVKLDIPGETLDSYLHKHKHRFQQIPHVLQKASRVIYFMRS